MKPLESLHDGRAFSISLLSSPVALVNATHPTGLIVDWEQFGRFLDEVGETR